MGFFRRHKEKNYSDNELLTLLRETGDSDYFNILYERYIPLVYGLCLKYLQDAATSKDEVMNIYEHLLNKVAGYEISNFKNWLYSVVKNHCFYILRENKKEILVDFDSNIMESDDVLNLFSEQEDKDKELALEQCMSKLPYPQYISVKKFFYEEKSYADIVEETGYHLKSVKSFLQNGKRNLKLCIEKVLQG